MHPRLRKGWVPIFFSLKFVAITGFNSALPSCDPLRVLRSRVRPLDFCINPYATVFEDLTGVRPTLFCTILWGLGRVTKICRLQRSRIRDTHPSEQM